MASKLSIENQKKIYEYLKSNVGWLCPVGGTFQKKGVENCWLHEDFIDKNEWMTHFE